MIPAGLARVLQESSGLCRIASQSLDIGSLAGLGQSLAGFSAKLGKIPS